MGEPLHLGRSAGRLRAGRAAALVIVCLLGLGACGPAAVPQPPESLQIRINLLCSTCDDFLRCAPDSSAGAGRYLLYRLREKSFWAQVATIWDYLVQWLRRKSADTRPLTIYENDGGTRRVLLAEGLARIDAASGLISLPDASIDMRNGEWRSRVGALQGRCTPLKRREGYAWLRGLLGRELPAGPPR